MKLTKECKKDIKKISKGSVSPYDVVKSIFVVTSDKGYDITGISDQYYSLETFEDGKFLKSVIDYAQKQIDKNEEKAKNEYDRDN